MQLEKLLGSGVGGEGEKYDFVTHRGHSIGILYGQHLFQKGKTGFP